MKFIGFNRSQSIVKQLVDETGMKLINLNVPVPVIALSSYRRFYSHQEDGYGAKLLVTSLADTR